MPEEAQATTQAVCDNCGFTAPDGSDEWVTVMHPPLGRITQCPVCGSNDYFDLVDANVE